jgi:uncharacterized protein
MQKNKTDDVITDTCLEKSISFIKSSFLANRKDDDLLIYSITGGEPLLYFEKIKNIVESFSQFVEFHNKKGCHFELSTNLSLLNNENMNFLIENNCHFYIGFDGIESAFNSGRLDKAGQSNTFEIVYNNLNNLCNRTNRDNITLNMVITPNNVFHLYESFNFIYNNFSDIVISLNIAYNENWKDEDIIILKRQLQLSGEFYCNIITEKNERFSIRLFDDQIENNIYGIKHSEPKCGGGKNIFTIDTDGTLYTCGNFIACGIEKENVVIGTIYDNIDQNLVQEFQKSLQHIKREECVQCAFYSRCYTYCPFANYMGSGNMLIISEKQCEINKAIVITADNIIDMLYKKNINIVQNRFLG